MKDKTRVLILYKKEQEMLERVEELKKIQNELNHLKEVLKIKSESLREMVKAYKKTQEELQRDVSDKSIKIGKHLEFYDYPKIVFKVDGEDVFAKPVVAEILECKSACTENSGETKEGK